MEERQPDNPAGKSSGKGLDLFFDDQADLQEKSPSNEAINDETSSNGETDDELAKAIMENTDTTSQEAAVVAENAPDPETAVDALEEAAEQASEESPVTTEETSDAESQAAEDMDAASADAYEEESLSAVAEVEAPQEIENLAAKRPKPRQLLART